MNGLVEKVGEVTRLEDYLLHTIKGHTLHTETSAASSGVAFTAVAVGLVGALKPEDLTAREVVYAVGDDAAIYRFTDTLAPDQRIAVGPEPAR